VLQAAEDQRLLQEHARREVACELGPPLPLRLAPSPI
jgi:hypothetical protein